MDNFTPDDIFGSLEEYLKFTGLTIQDLLKKVDGEISLLKIRLANKLKELDTTDPLITAIYQTLEKKRKNRERYLKWIK